MKILLLLIVLNNPSVCYVGGNPKSVEIVSSKEEASMILKQRNMHTAWYDSYTGELYEIYLSSSTKINIPEIEFKESK